MNRFRFSSKEKIDNFLGCPACGGEQICGCASCIKHDPNKKNIVTYKWLADGEHISCGHCGFTMHADAWEERSMQYSRAMGD